MPLIRGASALVIRCFRRVEKAADVITGAAGPYFIVLAWALTGFVAFAFFDVIARNYGWLGTVLMLPLYILVPLNMYGQYYLVTHVSPGFPVIRTEKDSRWISHNPRSLVAPERWGFYRSPAAGGNAMMNGISPVVGGGEQQQQMPDRVRRCRKCDGPKPERTHHCSVCKRCVLLMDHHCPWINACVGLHNQRHFVLFMAWLGLGCWIVVALGWGHFMKSLDFFGGSRDEWAAFTPPVGWTLAYILSIAIGVAVPVLGGWHVFMIMRGETSIEAHDNDYLEKKAREDGLIYLNPYDMGRRRNLEIFFNLGRGGYPLTTLLFPLVVPPYSNGWTFARRSMPVDPSTAPLLASGLRATGYDSRDPAASSPTIDEHEQVLGNGDGPGGRYVMGGGEDLTDDEDGGGGWWEGNVDDSSLL